MSILTGSTIQTKSAFAIIIGISQYRDPDIPRLNFTHADAQSFCDLLLDPQRAGFVKENVKLLLDDQATLSNIKQAISGWLFQHATPDSMVFVFFAGHGGVESDKTNSESDGIAKYLLPWDADHNNLFASALSNTDFDKLLNIIRARRLVIFLDACYAGGVTQRGARDVGIAENTYERLIQGEGRLVIASAKPNQRSWEDTSIGHGIFTYHLLEAMQGKADLDNDGYVSIWEVYKYLQQEVPKSVRRLAKSIQEPLLCGNISSDIVLASNAIRIAEIDSQQAEVERQRKEEMQARRRKLFDFNDQGHLPLDAYQEAISLITKPVTEIITPEDKLLKNLEALLKGGISPELYLINRELILKGPPQTSTSPKSSKTQGKYCFRCGRQLYPQNKFCVGCGRKIQN